MTQIIRTVGELEALDPDTYLLDTDDDGFNATQWLHGYEETLGEEIFPLAVIATGEQVRAARGALEKEGEKANVPGI